MTPVAIVVSMAEHFSCLKHNTHNGEILVVVVTICTQLTLKKVISLEQNLNDCWVLITGERERVNLCPAGRMFARSAKRVKSDPALAEASCDCRAS